MPKFPLLLIIKFLLGIITHAKYGIRNDERTYFETGYPLNSIFGLPSVIITVYVLFVVLKKDVLYFISAYRCSFAKTRSM